jgi:hypothetical protein
MLTIQAIMKYVDFTVQGNGENLELLKGMPAEVGVKTSKYIVVTADVTEVRVWLGCELDSKEKQRLVQGVWSFLDSNHLVSMAVQTIG